MINWKAAGTTHCNVVKSVVIGESKGKRGYYDCKQAMTRAPYH